MCSITNTHSKGMASQTGKTTSGGLKVVMKAIAMKTTIRNTFMVCWEIRNAVSRSVRRRSSSRR